MTDTIERLHTIRDHLRTGRFGQREVWEEWLTEAAAEIERLRRRLNEVDAQLTAEDSIHARECMALRAEKDAEIERLRAEATEWRERWEAERWDHEATIKAFDKAMNEGPP